MTPPWRGRILHKPTQKALRMAFDAQAPLDATPTEVVRKRRAKFVEDSVPEFDGIGGTDDSIINK